MKSLKDKIIIITGGSGLLGSAIISKLNSYGAIPINIDVRITDTKAIASIKMDISNSEEWQETISKILLDFGRLDGFVSNAYPKPKGYGQYNFQFTTHEQWSQFVESNLKGYYLSAYYTLEAMRKCEKGGSFVNMASIYGILAPDFSLYEGTDMNFPGEYTMVKGGIINFTRFLASVYGKHGIRVNSVSPGGISNHQPEQFVERYSRKVMLGRMGEAEEVAESVCFLLSDESSYITAHNLIIDGGLSMS
jgi:NAD(P)-dependent dehydrogenase (short-subunit alcohol dehydrogenase family)